MMKKRNRGKRNVQVLAAAALTAALIAGQIQPLPVQGSSGQIQVSSLIPDNVTIEHPVPLSEISLPGSDYGTLSWLDSSSSLMTWYFIRMILLTWRRFPVGTEYPTGFTAVSLW